MTDASGAGRPPRRRNSQRDRRGATAVELGFVLMLFLLLVLGMLDLGIAVFRYHILAEAARQGARKAIVHGGLAETLGPWGPVAFTGSGLDSHPLVSNEDEGVSGVRRILATLDPAEVSVDAQWIDGGNDRDDRVQVTVSVPYRPILTFPFSKTLTLSATSTMHIAH